jgi:hypothetical protein
MPRIDGMAGALQLFREEQRIEADVVSGDDGAGQRREHISGNLFEPWSIGEIGGPDPVDVGIAQIAVRVHQRGEHAPRRLADVPADDRDLENAIVPAWIQAGGFDVDDRDIQAA